MMLKFANALWKLWVIFFIGVFLVLVWMSNTNRFRVWKEQQYVLLAKSFLAGKTYLLEAPDNWVDTTIANGKHYWPLGPLPSVLMTFPVWAFGPTGKVFPQGYFLLTMFVGVFFLSYYIARKFSYASWDALLLAFALCLASVYQIAAFVPFVWYVVQALTVFLTMTAIGEHLTAKRYWVIGILMGAVFAARFTAGMGIIFFLLEAVWEKGNIKQKVHRVAQLIIPTVVVGVLLLVYNQVRFGNIWDNGYMSQTRGILTDTMRYETINYSLFKLGNIPTNIYYYFIKSPEPVTVAHQSLYGNTYVLQWPYIKTTFPGVSFFVVAPIFLFMVRASFKERRIKFAGITALVILFMLLTYYWPGWRQSGPRYLMDLLPFIYLILLKSFPGHKLSYGVQLLIMWSAMINLLLLSQAVSV